MHGFVCVAVLGILPCRRALGSSAHIDTPFATDTQAADAAAKATDGATGAAGVAVSGDRVVMRGVAVAETGGPWCVTHTHTHTHTRTLS